MQFKTLQEIENYINTKLQEILGTEVSSVVKKEMKENIEDTVYSNASNLAYKRRNSDGGLLDDENIVSEITKDGKLSVKNITDAGESFFGEEYNSPNSTEFAKWIEYGKVPIPQLVKTTSKPHPTFPARPFMENTVKDLKSSKKIQDSVKEGLRKRNIKIK